VIVSTDDEAIASVAKQYGAEVPFLRPGEISGDRSLLSDASKFTLNALAEKGYYSDISVYLYPTHPFRTSRLVDFCVGKLIEGHRTVHTVKSVMHDGCSLFSETCGTLNPLLNVSGKKESGQKYCRPYGTVFGRNPEGTKKEYLYELTDPVTMIDIDTLQDLYFAEAIISNDLFNFGS
jgi:CMP-N-acetylneuraminic acid synthetase